MEKIKLEDCSHEERKEHPNYCFECIKSSNLKDLTNKDMDKILEELLKQRQELTDKIIELRGSAYPQTRETLLGNVKSLDEVLKEIVKKQGESLTPPHQ